MLRIKQKELFQETLAMLDIKAGCDNAKVSRGGFVSHRVWGSSRRVMEHLFMITSEIL